MSLSFHRFQLGSFECVALYDGYHDHKLENMVTNAPRSEVQAALQALGLSPQFVTTPYTSLYVDTGVDWVLVDTGGGEVLETTGNLLNNMHKAGIEPESIDTVIITHAHPDHVGGLLDERARRSFPRQPITYAKENGNSGFLKMQMSIPGEDAAIYPEKTVADRSPNRPAGTRRRNPAGGERAVCTRSHPRAHGDILYISWRAAFIHGDVALHPIDLVHPDWLAVFDITPEMAVVSRQRIFDLAAATGCWVVGQQFPPFPSLGHVVKKGIGWEWLPIGIFEETNHDNRRE